MLKVVSFTLENETLSGPTPGSVGDKAPKINNVEGEIKIIMDLASKGMVRVIFMKHINSIHFLYVMEVFKLDIREIFPNFPLLLNLNLKEPFLHAVGALKLRVIGAKDIIPPLFRCKYKCMCSCPTVNCREF